jgi:hypothetical protein
MILKIFTVRDNVASAFLQPFFSVNSGSAIRSLTEVTNDKDHQFGKHAPDYSLWIIGSFDDTTGVVLPCEPTRLLGLADLLSKPA